MGFSMGEVTVAARDTTWHCQETLNLAQAIRAHDKQVCEAILGSKGLRVFYPGVKFDHRSGVAVVSTGKDDESVEALISGISRWVTGFVTSRNTVTAGENARLMAHIFPPERDTPSMLIRVEVWKRPGLQTEAKLPQLRK